MKFSLISTSSAARLGIITNVFRLPDFELETPHALLYTRVSFIFVSELGCNIQNFPSDCNLNYSTRQNSRTFNGHFVDG